MNETPELSIVVPAWNEGKRIIRTLESIDAYLSSRNIRAEVLVVDDGSEDDMVDQIASIQSKMPYIKILSYAPNHGKGYATRYGVLRAQGDIVLFMDSDGSTSIDHFDAMQKKFNEGADVVISNRYLKESHIRVKQPWLRRLLSRSANKLIQVILLWGVTDTQNGFKAFTKEAAKSIFERVTIDRWGFDMEVLVIARKQGYTIAEIPVTWNNDADTRIKFAADSTQTLHDLIYIKTNLIKGRYDAKNSTSLENESESEEA